MSPTKAWSRRGTGGLVLLLGAGFMVGEMALPGSTEFFMALPNSYSDQQLKICRRTDIPVS